jgi:hypothetical protein
LFQYLADLLLTCVLHRQLLHELHQFSIHVPAKPTDDFTDFCLEQFMRYGMERVMSRFPSTYSEIPPWNRLTLLNTSGSKYNGEIDDDSQLNYEYCTPSVIVRLAAD